jgi:hypothetical protein
MTVVDVSTLSRSVSTNTKTILHSTVVCRFITVEEFRSMVFILCMLVYKPNIRADNQNDLSLIRERCPKVLRDMQTLTSSKT